MPKLTPEESARLGGAEAEAEKFAASKEKKKLESKLKSGATVKAKKGELSEGTRVVDSTTAETAEQPKQLLKKTGLRSKLPSTQGIRAPKSGELRRGKTSIRVKKKAAPKDPTVEAPWRQKPTVRRNPVTGKAERIKPKKTTVTSLPAASAEDLGQIKIGPRAPLEMPRGGLKPQEIVKPNAPRGKQVERKLRGFASPVKVAAPKIWEAMSHIDALQNHQPGSPEHTKHAEAFNSMMPEVVKHTHSGVETILHGVRKIAFEGGNNQKHLNMAKDALTETISIARAMERRRSEARAKGRNNGS